MEYEIRRATREDTSRLGPLFDAYRQFYGQPSDPPLAETFIQDRLDKEEAVIFLAVSDSGEGLGFIQLFPSFSSVGVCRIWILNDLFVSPEARRSGVGRALMEQARAHTRETGGRRLMLETQTDNQKAQALYEDLGYVCQNDVTKHYSLEVE